MSNQSTRVRSTIESSQPDIFHGPRIEYNPSSLRSFYYKSPYKFNSFTSYYRSPGRHYNVVNNTHLQQESPYKECKVITYQTPYKSHPHDFEFNR